MIVNNWFVICDGFVAVTSPWARVFFVTFYVCGPLVILNIAVAAVMDAFLSIVERAETPEANSEGTRTSVLDEPLDQFAAHLEADGATAVIDASSVSGTSTGLSGVYRAFVSSQIARHRHAEMLQSWLLGVRSNRGDPGVVASAPP